MQTETFENRKIRVTYPDAKNEHEITFDELYQRFAEERPEWLQSFVAKLIMNGSAITNMGAKYEML